MGKIENWSRLKGEETSKTPYVWGWDNSDKVIETGAIEKPIQVYLYKVDEGVYRVFSQNDQYMPRGFENELKYGEDDYQAEYAKEEGRQAIADYLKRHPMRLKTIGYETLERRLDENYGTTDQDKDIKYFLQDIMEDFGRGTDYEYEKLPGSGQLIIYGLGGEKVYDSENKRLSKQEALSLAQNIVMDGSNLVIDYNLEPKYQTKGMDDLIDDTLLS